MLPFTKRITRDNNYKRPDQTLQDILGLDDIKDKLKDYKKVENIMKVPINSHLRYFTIDMKGGGKPKKVFRLGGNLTKIDDQGRYVVLSNGQLSWSVQTNNAQFWQKMTTEELKNELKTEVKKELIRESEQIGGFLPKPMIGSGSISNVQDTNKYLEMENNELKRENKDILRKMAALTEQIHTIKKEVKKTKTKK